jgi:hypothetical protein
LLAHALAGVALLCHIVSIDNTHSRYNFLECHPALRSRVEECEAFIWCCPCPPSAFCRRPAGARRRKAPAFAKTTRFELKVTNLNEIAQTLAALEASQFLIVISSPERGAKQIRRRGSAPLQDAGPRRTSKTLLRCDISNRLRSAWGQKPALPHRSIAVRSTSVNGHSARRGTCWTGWLDNHSAEVACPPIPYRVKGSLESNYYGDRYVHLRGAAPFESPKVSILAQATLAHVIALARRLGRGSLFGEPGSVALRGSAH